MNSPYKNTVVANNLRYIDWSLITEPKVLDLEDYDNVIRSGSLFGRKFDYNISNTLVDKIDKTIGVEKK